MKKIITLALAAVMTLGLTVLPQATPEEDYTKQEKTVAEKETAVKAAKAELNLAESKLSVAEQELAAAKDNEKDAKKQAVKDAKDVVATKKEAYEAAVKALNEAKEALSKLEYTYVTIKDERTDKFLAKEVVVKSGTYTVDELMAATGADKNAEHGWVLADKQSKYVTISGRHTTVVVKVATKVQIKVFPVDEEGRSLGHAFDAKVNVVADFVTAMEVAPKELTFEGKIVENLGVNGYFVLADVDANHKHYYINEYTKGGVMELTAVYTKAMAKKYTGKDGKNGKGTKNGQVGKTGEVATVATGIGALMTLAGVVVATKRH
ncbi:hypothetical protein PYS61_01200 [Amygdalobacter indicium]|uniref:Uncharacterized protein n=1 Tax=Amygdalobacter indicium TaxID=3029272 RepID=A0ABY8CAF3_9FIRM|nr:hypothetical protein [Amygdalobacter indicium]WEG35810.1 hypothetical protein PYS61_01200 [Amygdalobacter indicium]